MLVFSVPTPAEAEKLYEGYRAAEEPDSPGIPFSELPESEKEKVVASFQTCQLCVFSENVFLGFVSINPEREKPEVNVGMYLFPDQRGKGLASWVLKGLVPVVLRDFPGHEIISSTRTENSAMINVLLTAGFVKIGTEVRRPLGKWDKAIEYQCFRWPFHP